MKVMYNYEDVDDDVLFICINGHNCEDIGKMKAQCIINNRKFDIIYIISDRIELSVPMLDSMVELLTRG
jgi:hypothetical protein